MPACLRSGNTNNAWIAWQFHRPDLNEGMIQVFRRAESSAENLRLKLNGLRPDARYALTRFNASSPPVETGVALMRQGVSVSINEKPGAAVFVYRLAK